MIRTLRVRNLALIDELELDLSPGLNVLTGETGAGKSLLLDAIAMLCGRRVSPDIVRSGESEASVEAIFEAPALSARAAAAGFGEVGAQELLVARRVVREGRGKAFVNGRLATTSLLSELLAGAIEVMSQGEHQQLLRAELQAQLLDRYAGVEALAAEVQQLHARWLALTREGNERRSNAEEQARTEDRLRFELAQIEAVAPKPGELAELEAEQARLAHVDQLTREVGSARHGLEEEAGVLEGLRAAAAALARATRLDPELGERLQGLERLEIEAGEAAGELERYLAGLEADPQRLVRVDERLGQLAELRRRYGSTIEEILTHRDRARDALEALGGGEARSEALERELQEVAETLDGSARRLGRVRREAAGALSRAVGKELKGLDLAGACLQVDFTPRSAKTREGFEAPSSPLGRERASFCLVANPGEEPRPLREAASGGELSRLLLALRNVLREVDGGRILLFDEVDAGINGRTAGRVGLRLQALARTSQILCITHLPQIAARGSTQYRVGKRRRGGRAVTEVRRLDGEERVEEIARMASGGSITTAARAHARELLGLE